MANFYNSIEPKLTEELQGIINNVGDKSVGYTTNQLFTKLLLTLCFIFSSWISPSAQTTYFDPSDYCVSKTDKDVYVSKVDIYKNYTFVDITIVPKKNIARLTYWYSKSAYLLADNKRYKLLGAVDEDKEQYHTCTYSDGWGWNNAKAGYEYTFTLVFEGGIAVGVEECSLIDKGTKPGTSFEGIWLNNSPFGDVEHEASFVHGKAYLAYTNATVSMKEGAGANYQTVETLKPGTVLVIDTREAYGDYYYVTNFDTGSEGYVKKSKVSPYEIIPESDGSFFQESKYSNYHQDPRIEITNSTNKTLTLTLNGTKHKISAYKTINVTMPAGVCKFKATAPGVMPYIGSKSLRTDYEYTWEFYIIYD